MWFFNNKFLKIRIGWKIRVLWCGTCFGAGYRLSLIDRAIIDTLIDALGIENNAASGSKDQSADLLALAFEEGSLWASAEGRNLR